MHGFTSNSTVAWQVKRGPTATGSFNLPNGAVTPRISSPSDRNQMGRACSLQLQRKDQQPWLPWSGCHERFLRLVVPTGRIRHSKVPKYSGLSIYLSIFPGIFPGLGMSWDVLGTSQLFPVTGIVCDDQFGPQSIDLRCGVWGSCLTSSRATWLEADGLKVNPR